MRNFTGAVIGLVDLIWTNLLPLENHRNSLPAIKYILYIRVHLGGILMEIKSLATRVRR